ncbi:hypothetical protein SAMN06265222_103385 [Neorhodopirellula lusitana]|uniref:IgA-specific metalloendopeptidase n=1 Tax=Neorhodopirellula lusitana TaxID=445327 RepID=A0ABY1PYH0_9BACT|nr:hypothetical protein [Neorhodopirellula lusitana]SMP51958.1 hypothetical protein SAMN06265222_103385 [Neorhodopirellula lusitana]
MSDATGLGTSSVMMRRSAATGGGQTGAHEASLRLPTQVALERFANRRARLLKIRGVAIGVTVLVFGLALLAMADHFLRWSTPWRVVGSLVVNAIAIASAWRSGIRDSRKRDWSAIARSIETTTPALHEQMISAVELRDTDSENGSIEFRKALQDQVASAVSQLPIPKLLPWSLIRRPLFGALAAVGLMLVSGLIPSWQMPRRMARAFLPIVPIERASLTKIQILRPSPASRSVAEGDLVAIAVAVERLGNGDVTVQWRSETTPVESLVMSPRQMLDSSTQDRAGETFAVNLPVHQAPVSYRVLAGDAETLWHQLTPRPRPKMVGFHKRYRFPDYAKLADLVVEEPDGDLSSFVGTVAEVTVKFDQPVRDVELLFGGRGSVTRVPASGEKDSLTEFQYQVPIKTSGSYRIDSVGTESELNNPFAPRFSIDPVIDQAPTATWNEGTLERQIVSPVAVLKIGGMLEDDLPMDQYVQQIVLDDGPVISRNIALNPVVAVDDAKTTASQFPAFRQISPVSIQWDMMRSTGTGDDVPLPSGSLLKTRLVAVDRAGNRGASPWMEVFIAGSDFDADRHERLRGYRVLVRRTQAWLNELADLAGEVQLASQKGKAEENDVVILEPEWSARVADLRSRWSEISGIPVIADDDFQTTIDTGPDASPLVSIAELVSRTSDSVESDRWVALDHFAFQSVWELDRCLNQWALSNEAAKLNQTQSDGTKGRRSPVVQQVAGVASRSEKAAKQAAEMSGWMLSLELSAGVLKDLLSIESNMGLIADPNATVPIERLPGQAELIVERLHQVDDLLSGMEKDLPLSSRRYQDNLHRQLGEIAERVEEIHGKLLLDRDPDVVIHFRESMQDATDQLRSRVMRHLLQSEVFQRLAANTRELNRRESQSSRMIESVQKARRDWRHAGDQVRKARLRQDTSELDAASQRDRELQFEYDANLDLATNAYQRMEVVERSRRDSMVQAASDWKLIRNSLQVITKVDFEPLPEQTIDGTWRVLVESAAILESGQQVIRLARQLQDLADRERYGQSVVDALIHQTARLEHFHVVSEVPLQRLRESGVEADVISDLQDARWDQDFQQSRQWMTSRRNELGDFLSVTDPVQRMASRYQAGLPIIEKAMEDARSRLRQLLPTTGELARRAAEEAKKQSTQEGGGGDPPSAEADQKRLEEYIDAVVENLADRANTADYRDESQRELARDADATIAKIADLMEAIANADRIEAGESDTGESIADPSGAKPASGAEKANSLDELSETLQTAAEHFDAADSGASVESTRQDLRGGVPSNEAADDAQNAESTSRAANESPEELLKKLERQLARDQAMQNDLAEISQETVAAVEQTVRSVAQQEQNLRSELEKSDAAFWERKRQLRDQFQAMVDQARAVNDHWLGMAENASVWKQDSKALDVISESRLQVREALERAAQVQGDDSLLDDLEKAVVELRESLGRAVADVQPVQETATSQSDEEVYKTEKERQQRARQLESAQRRTQNLWLKSLTEQSKNWKYRRDEAKRRVQNSEKELANAHQQLRQADEQLKKHADADWAQRGATESRQRVDAAEASVKQTKLTQQAAGLAEQEAIDRLSTERKKSVQDLEAKDPKAELLARVTGKSVGELSRVVDSLKQLEDQSELAASLSPLPRRSKELSGKQAQVNRAIRQASEDLRRAARHEQRLGKPQAAKVLSEAADDLSAVHDDPMKRAVESLDALTSLPDGSPDPDRTTEPDRTAEPERPPAQREDANSESSAPAKQAGERLQDAAAELLANATQLSEIREASSQSNPSPEASKDLESTGTAAEASRSEKLARTLDELDRSIQARNQLQALAQEAFKQQQPSSEDETGEAAEQSSANRSSAESSDQSNGESSENSSSQSSEGSPNGQPSPQGKPTAGDASSTLAAAAQQAIRELAAKRQRQLQQIADAGKNKSDGPSSQESANNSSDSSGDSASDDPFGQLGEPGNESGEGQKMPSGGMLDAAAQARIDGQWGSLRARRNDDGIQDRKATVPLSYRPAVEAYFQAISAEAARSAPAGQGEDQP